MKYLLIFLCLSTVSAQTGWNKYLFWNTKKGPVRGGMIGGWNLGSVNLLRYSAAASSANWGAPFSATVTQNTSMSPDGTTTGDTLTFAANANYAYAGYTLGSSIQGRTYTCSMWLWSYAKTDVGIRLNASITGLDMSTARIAVTFTPTRYSVSRTFTSTDQQIDCGIDNRSDVIGGVAFSAGDVVVWGIQLNEGSTALPYQATTDLQTVPNMVADGAALTLGSTSGVDANDPTRTLSGMVFATDDYASFPNPMDGSLATLTISGAMNTVSASNPLLSSVFDVNHRLEIFPDSGTIAYFSSSDGSSSTDVTASKSALFGSDGAPFDISWVIKQPQTLYIGASTATASGSVTFVPNVSTGANFIVGKRGSSYLNGKLYYILIYNRALSPKEIRHNHQWLKSEMAKVGVSLP